MANAAGADVSELPWCFYTGVGKSAWEFLISLLTPRVSSSFGRSRESYGSSQFSPDIARPTATM